MGRLGFDGPWRDWISETIGHLIAHGRRLDGFYIHKFRADGGIADERADFYDQAFMLFCLGHAGRLLQREDLYDAAEHLGDALLTHWRHPSGGYSEGEIAKQPPRRQNPHMHLFEASIALHQTSGRDRWDILSHEIFELCINHFIDVNTGALLEYFDDHLSPLTSDQGQRIEPGHCFEWAWLFERYAGHTETGQSISDGLITFARRFGIDRQRGIAINEVMPDGTIHDPCGRLWPQTERLKAALARLRRIGTDEEASEVHDAYLGLKKYFATGPIATWRDKLNADGRFRDELAPGSSLYHIVCSLAELVDTVDCLQTESRA
jgi:mannose-6-phosphate isomerase